MILSVLGQTIQFTAAVVDQKGEPIADQTVIWSSSDAAVATVSVVGLLTAVGNGNTAVTAHSGTLSSVPTPVTVAQEVTLLEKVAGDGQSGSVGAALPTAITVRARDGGGSPIAGATVDFAVTQGSGSVSAAHVVTAADGQAGVTWTLGMSAGSAQEVTVSARRMQFAVHPTPANYPEPTPQTFQATALPGPAAP